MLGVIQSQGTDKGSAVMPQSSAVAVCPLCVECDIHFIDVRISECANVQIKMQIQMEDVRMC